MTEDEIKKKILEGVSIMHTDYINRETDDFPFIINKLMQLQQNLIEIQEIKNNGSSIH